MAISPPIDCLVVGSDKPFIIINPGRAAVKTRVSGSVEMIPVEDIESLIGGGELTK